MFNYGQPKYLIQLRTSVPRELTEFNLHILFLYIWNENWNQIKPSGMT